VENEFKFKIKKEDKALLVESLAILKTLDLLIIETEEAADRSLDRYIKDLKDVLIPKLDIEAHDLDQLV